MPLDPAMRKVTDITQAVVSSSLGKGATTFVNAGLEAKIIVPDRIAGAAMSASIAVQGFMISPNRSLFAMDDRRTVIALLRATADLLQTTLE